MPRSLVFACGTLLFAVVATAQLRSGIPAPLPGLPMTPPPIDQPALAAQPLMGDGPRAPATGGSGGETKPPPAAPMPAPEPGTAGRQKEGKELKRAIAKVNALHWYENLGEAKARSAATSKPILLVQALGDLEGFA